LGKGELIMKLFVLIFAGALLANSAEPARTRRTAAKPAAKAEGGLAIPADAEVVSPGVWRKVENGKAWIYRKTPFGVVRVPDEQQAAASPAASNIAVREDGEVLHFTQTTPFGKREWTKVASELNEEEQRVVTAMRSAKKGS
jgi:hypothetical protein